MLFLLVGNERKEVREMRSGVDDVAVVLLY